MKNRAIAFLLLSLTVSSAFAGAMFQWKDEKGQIHISDIPPKGDVQYIQKNTTVESWSSARSSSDKTQQANDAKKKDDNKEQKKDEISAAEKAENCSTAKSAKATLLSGKRISVVDDKGELVYLDESMIAKKLEAAEKAISSWCTDNKGK